MNPDCHLWPGFCVPRREEHWPSFLVQLGGGKDYLPWTKGRSNNLKCRGSTGEPVKVSVFAVLTSERQSFQQGKSHCSTGSVVKSKLCSHRQMEKSSSPFTGLKTSGKNWPSDLAWPWEGRSQRATQSSPEAGICCQGEPPLFLPSPSTAWVLSQSQSCSIPSLYRDCHWLHIYTLGKIPNWMSFSFHTSGFQIGLKEAKSLN